MSTQLKAIVEQLLTPVSSAYVPEGCIAEQILPMVKSKQYSGKLGKYGTSHLRIENSVVGGKGKFRRVESIVRQTSSYEIESHGLEGLVTKRDYANVTEPFDAEKDEVMGLTTILLLEKEFSLASSLTSTSNITQNTTLSGSSQLSDYVNSDPLTIFKNARAAVIDGCGKSADTCMMDARTADVLRYHPALMDVLGFKYNQTGGMGDDDLAKALKIKRLLIADARYESAKEGQTSSLAAVWGKDIVFGVFPTAAQPYQVSGGYMIVPEGSAPRKVYKESVFNPPGSTEILVEDEYDMLLSNLGAIYLVKSAVA